MPAMPLRIGQASDALRRSGRPRATDYTQREVRWRLFTWLALLMLVLALAERAGDRRTWQWRKRGASPSSAATTVALSPGGAAASRLTPHPSDALPAGGSAVASASSSSPQRGPASDEPNEYRPSTSAAGAGAAAPPAVDRQALQRLWGQLTEAQRQQLAELVRVGLQPPARSPPATPTAIDWLDRIAGPEAPSGTFLPALRAALEAVVAEKPLTQEQRSLLQAVQSVLRPSLLSAVEDGTAIFRPAEREAWLYVLDYCRVLGSEGLRQASRGRVAYVQLDQQPEVYRGQVVTIVGRVRRAYRVPALPNPLGIQEYAVYWVLTEGGPDAPVVVYALNIPPGFPDLPQWEQTPGGAVLNEPVEISGVFLKRAAYRAEGGVFTAPLLLAHTPRWQPPPPAPPPRGMETALLGLVVASLVSLVAVVWIWRRTRRKPGPARGVGEQVMLPAGLDVTPRPHVALHQLEQTTEESPP